MIERYSRPAMARIWSEESKLEDPLRIELAARGAWAGLGAAPEEDLRAIRGRAAAPRPDRVAELERATDHDTARRLPLLGPPPRLHARPVPLARRLVVFERLNALARREEAVHA